MITRNSRNSTGRNKECQKLKVEKVVLKNSVACTKAVFKEVNKLLTNLKNEQTNCVICCNKIVRRCYLQKCLHSFCLSCLTKWARKKQNCPTCGEEFFAVFCYVRSIRTYRIREFVKTHQHRPSPCLLRSMKNVTSFYKIGENLNLILQKYNMSFGAFHDNMSFA